MERNKLLSAELLVLEEMGNYEATSPQATILYELAKEIGNIQHRISKMDNFLNLK